MISRIILIGFFAVGVLAEYTNIEDQQLSIVLRQLSRRNDTRLLSRMEQLQKAPNNYFICLKNLIDGDLFLKEVQEASLSGVFNDVTKMLCAITPEIKTCIHTYQSAVGSLYSYDQGTVSNATDEIIDFMCYNDGERIATFITEGGTLCVRDNVLQLNECVSNVANGVNTEDMTLSKDQLCRKSNEFSTCITNVLKGCNSRYVQDLVESVFQLQRKSNICVA